MWPRKWHGTLCSATSNEKSFAGTPVHTIQELKNENVIGSRILSPVWFPEKLIKGLSSSSLWMLSMTNSTNLSSSSDWRSPSPWLCSDSLCRQREIRKSLVCWSGKKKEGSRSRRLRVWFSHRTHWKSQSSDGSKTKEHAHDVYITTLCIP